uniref:PPAF-2-like Clip domain-containing protein n=1 Tax=Cacopsylla melanoneura TaxID=428564 RepID=A0A8D8S377_9HEMI
MSGLALVILSVITSTLSHPYGPAASQHSGSTSSSGGGGYVASGNDQLRFHPEESQFYSNQPTQPQQTAPVNNAPSYADLVNLAQQEAQQQAIIDAQKKMETNKLVKDIEFIQKQQEILQQQVHAQEVKNEQKLNNPGSYAGSTGSSAQSSSGSYGSNSGSAYNPQQSNSPATFSSGQWVPDNNAQKYNDGLYKGEGSHTKPSSSAGGSYSGADSFSGASSQQSVTQKHHQTGHSGPSNSGGYGSSGGGTPGISYPDYQPDDVERVPCTQLGHTCVAKHLCVNGKVNSNGIGLIQLRFSMKSCRADIEACCKEDAGVEGSYSPPPSSYQPKPSSGPVDSYGQPTSSYALPPGESCSACAGGDGGSYSHQNSQETSFHHKQQSSSSYNSGSANLPSAKLPDFGPPSVGGAGYGK